MSAEARIMQALSPFGYPCTADVYTGSEKRFFTYNPEDERGADFGDDEPDCTVVWMQIHYFLPLNINATKEKRQIREALFQAGFTYPEITVMVDKENHVRHIIYSCSIAAEREE